MNILKKVWDWIYYSSQNPEKISLTLKGAIPFVLMVLAWGQWGAGINADTLNEGAALFVSAIVKFAELITAILALAGFARKIYNSFKA